MPAALACCGWPPSANSGWPVGALTAGSVDAIVARDDRLCMPREKPGIPTARALQELADAVHSLFANPGPVNVSRYLASSRALEASRVRVPAANVGKRKAA